MEQKILLVDDEKSFRDSIRLFLEDYDFVIEEADNGLEGIEKIRSFQPDLVLIDLYMPEMSGLDVLQWVSEHRPEQPVIVISGAGVIHDVAEALRRGAWDYIFKPIEDLSVLKHAVDKALERARLIETSRHYQQELEDEVRLRTNDLREANKEMARKQNEILRFGVEEKVLGKLLQFTLRCKDEKAFLSESLQLLIRELGEWHGIDRGLVYHLPKPAKDAAAVEWRLLDYAALADVSPYRQPEFVRCLKDKLALPLGQCFAPETCMQQSICLLPAKQYDQVFAIFVLFPAGSKQGLNASSIEFLGRINAILGMGLGKFCNEREIQFLAYHDVLTGLANRRMLLERLQQSQQEVQHNHWNGVLLYIDLDRFKHLNDALGHDAGDKLLQEVARRLAAAIRNNGLVARLGGDEFAILLVEYKAALLEMLVDIQKTIERIQQQLRLPYFLQQHEYYLTSSIGVCVFSDASEAPADLLKHADTAMHYAKARGGNTFRFFQPDMQEAADSRLALEKDLRAALKQEQMELYYQPQLDIETGWIIGAEALVRWHHPQRGWVPPMDFIPVAEETDMILALGEWILCEALRQIQQWERAGLLRDVDSIAVNICPKQFRQPGFADKLIDYIRSREVPPELLKLEITESILIDNVEETIVKMNKLKRFGLHFSMDDFGTGYSSLSYLKRLPLDQLKIDQSFVNDIGDENGLAIVETIIAMGRHLGMDVIAEGVETDEALELLRQRGCASYQGYLFSKPVPADEFARMLGRQSQKSATSQKVRHQ